MPYTNVKVYEEIIYENYAEMISAINSNRTPREDGSNGYIIKYDPNQKSFKKSMIIVAFAGMWLEAIFHQYMIENYSKNQLNKHNKDRYKDKLVLMGITDTDLLGKVAKFQKTRNELIHEKAYMNNNDVKLAQKEAAIAYEIVNYVSQHNK